MLIVLCGLPGVGKTTLAEGLARHIGAVLVRIDTIEEALRVAWPGADLRDTGYRVAHALALENLRLGRDAIADCVNPWPETRRAWRDIADAAGDRCLLIELHCTDASEHRARVEARRAACPAAGVPDWAAVSNRDYRAPSAPDFRIDTAGRTAAETLAEVLIEINF